MNKLGRKWTYEEVKEIFNLRGFILLSDKYNNTDERLCFKDFEGYYYMMSLYNFYYDNCQPQKFQPSNPYTIQNIKLFIQNNELNFILLNKYYKNNSEKLTFRDSEGYLYSISLNNFLAFKNGKRFHKGNLYVLENIKLWCNLNNKPFELLSNTYEGSNKKLQWQKAKKKLKVFYVKRI